MDGGSFDRLTRLLAGRVTRRGGAAAAIAGLAGLAGVAGLEPGRQAEAARLGGRDSRQRRGRRPSQEGPCGDGRRKGNICTKNSQCCTGYCEVSLGKKNIDRKGRCRCLRRGEPCEAKQTCCGKAACVNGICARQNPTPPPPTCQETGGACASDADCCCGLSCAAGVCGPCVETVCTSGCTFTDVNAAYAAASAGDTIYIGPGTYPAGIVVTKDITLAACRCVTGVTLEPDRVAMDPPDSYYVIVTEDDVDAVTRHTVTVRNLTLRGTDAGVAQGDENLLNSATNGTVNWTIENSVVTRALTGLYAAGGDHVVTDSDFSDFAGSAIYQSYYGGDTAGMSLTMSGSSVSDCDSYGVIFYPETGVPTTANLTVTDCEFSGNAGFPLYYYNEPSLPRANRKAVVTNTVLKDNTGEYPALYAKSADLEVTGCTITGNIGNGIYVIDASATVKDTQIEGNTAPLDGGGILLIATGENASLTVSGTTLITGNNAGAGRFGGGIFRQEENSFTAAVSGTTTANVTSNLPDDCYAQGVGVVSCSTWTP